MARYIVAEDNLNLARIIRMDLSDRIEREFGAGGVGEFAICPTAADALREIKVAGPSLQLLTLDLELGPSVEEGFGVLAAVAEEQRRVVVIYSSFVEDWDTRLTHDYAIPRARIVHKKQGPEELWSACARVLGAS